ncbi:alpha/beta hydrolase [Serpentinicella sp. ANB-PHB4]|uniref:alpha/beta fold hydrolase n=1 Tax=Serpentinicella sp. ANB-PHB4 TaxID=3074076 RepID=UPI002858AACA|nr:alpha/beta hydrolase [Serpentinicella sp. ANB-PHB4]MDR5659331.1 alpha/beta hydrolase [Serpentinicella sp. ANB-PHB4]
MAYMDVNGVNLYYELKGNLEAEETVVFLNGVMASTNSWAMQVPVFEKDYRILLHDFKGQLLSDKPEGPYTFREHAEEAKILMEKLGIEKAHIIGTSYGGEVAMRLAIDFPGCVKSISVIDSVSELDEVLKLFVKGWRTAAVEKDPEKFYWGMAPTIYHNSFLEKNIETLKERAEALKKAPAEYFTGQVYLYDTFEQDVYMTEELHKIKCPAFIVCGEQDILKTRKFSEIIANNIEDAELAIIPDCGHVTIFEKPNTLNSMILGFVTKNK